MNSTELRSASLSSSVVLNSRKYDIEKCGEIKFTCGRCKQPHEGFGILALCSAFAGFHILIFQPNPEPCHIIFVCILSENDYLNVAKQMERGTINDLNCETYWFAGTFTNLSDLIHFFRPFWLQIKSERKENVTGVSFAMSFDREPLKTKPLDFYNLSGFFEGQYTIMVNYAQKEELKREMDKILPNLKKMPNDDTLAQKFHHFLDFDIYFLDIGTVIDSGISPEGLIFEFLLQKELPDHLFQWQFTPQEIAKKNDRAKKIMEHLPY